MRGLEHAHVAVKCAFGNKRRTKALNRHVGDSEKMVEPNTKCLAKDALVVSLQAHLARWQHGPLRVVDEIEFKRAARIAVAQ